MQSNDGLGKHLAIAFGFALGVYIIAYWLIEHQRTGKGPWEIRFEQGTNGNPVMVVNQPALNISNVKFEFQGTTPDSGTNTVKLPQNVKFEQPRPVPFPAGFGEVIFEDLTSLPGTITILCYGNEIEVLPRIMTVNRQKLPWKSGETLLLTPTNPPPKVELKKKKKKE